MSGLLPFSDHDVVSRRSPNGGTERSFLRAASSCHAVPFGSRPRETRAPSSGTRNGSHQQDLPVPHSGRVLAAVLIAAAMLGMGASAQAQQGDPQAKVAKEPGKDITVTGQRPNATCGGATSAQPIDYACLNSALKTATTAAQPAPSAADAITSQATTPSKVGTFSHTATAQRMGQNFGKSAQPYRPPAPVYTNPAAGRPPR